MANLFQQIGQRVKDVAGGLYNQVKTGDNKNFRSYLDDQERKRRQQQQEAAQRAAEQIKQRIAARAQQRQQQPQNTPQITVAKPTQQPKLQISKPGAPQVPTPQIRLAPPAPTPNIVMPNGQQIKMSPNARAGAPQPKVDNRNTASKIWDTINITDGGRSFNTPEAKGGSKSNFAKVKTFGREVAQGTVRIAPNIVTSLMEAGNGLDKKRNTATKVNDNNGLDILREFQNLSYEERKARLRKGKDNVNRIMLNQLGVDIDNPTDESVRSRYDEITKGNKKADEQTKKNEVSFTPGNRVEKFLLGEDKVESYQTRNRGNVKKLEEQGVAPSDAESIAGFGSLLTIAGDNPISGGAKRAVAKRLVEATDTNVIKQTLKEKGIQLAEDEAKAIAETKSKKEIAKVIDDAARRNAAAKQAGKEGTQKTIERGADEGLRLAGGRLEAPEPPTIDPNSLRELQPMQPIRINDTPTKTPDIDVDTERAALRQRAAAQRAANVGERGTTAPNTYSDDVESFINDVRGSNPNMKIDRSLNENELVDSINNQLAGDANPANDALRLADNTPEARMTNTPINLPAESSAPTGDLTERLRELTQKAIDDPTPETRSAMLELRREIAGREAAASRRSVVATPNQELIDQGLVDEAVDHVPTSSLKLGAETDPTEAVDEAQVQKYIEDILADRPIDPLIVSRSDTGETLVQDGKHRLEAINRLGIENAPVSNQSVRQAAGEVAQEAPAVAPRTVADADKDIDTFVNEYAGMLKSMDDGATGGQMIPDGEGGYRRISEHSPFYRRYFAENGRAPSSEAWREEARRTLENGQADEFATQDFNRLRQERGDLYEREMDMQDMVNNPQIPEDVPTSAGNGQTAKLGYNQSARGAKELSSDLRKGIDKDAEYAVSTNEDRLRVANQLLETRGLDGATAHVIDRVSNYKNITDQDVVDAQQVIKALDQSGDEAKRAQANSIISDLAEQLNRAGKTVQAASLLNNRTPEGIKFGAIKTLGKYGITPDGEVGAKLNDLTDVIRQGDDVIAALNKEKAGYQQAYEAATDAATKRAHLNDVIATNQKLEAAQYARDLSVYDMKQFVDSQLPTNIFKKGVAIWRAGLLTSPMTTAGNLTSNGVEMIIKKGYVDPVAAIFDAATSLFTKERTKTFTLRNQLGGTKEGIGQAVQYFKTGYDPRNAVDKFDARQVHFSDSPLGKIAEVYTQGVMRTMSVADQPFWYTYMRNSLADQALAAAKNAGVRGKERNQFIKDFITNPSESALQIATDEANYGTFQNKTLLGNIATSIKRTADNASPAAGAAGDFIIPFTQVPASLATRIIERTPIGIAKEIVSQARKGEFDQRAMSTAMANGTFGVAVIGAGAALASNGMITLGYPSDPNEAALWKAEGKQPFSVKVGDRWYSMNYMQPLGTHIAAGGAYAKAIAEGKSPTEAFTIAAAQAGNALTEQSFLKGVNSLMDTISDPERSASKFAENTVSGIVPNFIRATTRAADDSQREVNGIVDAVKQGIPGLRQTLPEKKDELGNVIPRNDNFANSLFNPLRPSKARGDETVAELRRLQDAKFGLSAPEVEDKVKFDGVETQLTAEQKRALQSDISDTTNAAWSQIMATPEYKALSDEDKAKVLANASGDIAAAARAKFAADNGLGQYAAGFNGKATKLSGKQDALLNGGFDPANYTSPNTDTKISKNVSSTSRSIISKIEGMPADKRKTYLEDPKNNYAYNLSKFENDMVDNKLSKVEQYNRVKELGKMKIQSNYSHDVIELYTLSKTKLKDFLQTNDITEDQKKGLLALDQQLYDEGFSSSRKFKYGLTGSKGSGGGGGGGGSEKTIKIPAPKFGSFSAVQAPNSPNPTINSVLKDFQTRIADIKVLQGTQIAPGDDSSTIKIAV